jgi:hypothetical protein
MSNLVTIAFARDREYVFGVSEAEVQAVSKDEARAWMSREFEALECTPSSPVGKVLVLDMILNVAKYGGENRFREAGDWARQFATMTVALLDRPAIRVDVGAFLVG